MAIKLNSRNVGLRSGPTTQQLASQGYLWINNSDQRDTVVLYFQGQIEPTYPDYFQHDPKPLIRTIAYGWGGEKPSSSNLPNDRTAYGEEVDASVSYALNTSTNLVDITFKYYTGFTLQSGSTDRGYYRNEIKEVWSGIPQSTLATSFDIFWRTTASGTTPGSPDHEFRINGKTYTEWGINRTLTNTNTQIGPYYEDPAHPANYIVDNRNQTGNFLLPTGYSLQRVTIHSSTDSYAYSRAVTGDRLWIKGFASGDTKPNAANFVSNVGVFAGINRDGILTFAPGNGIKGNVYIYDRNASRTQTVVNRGTGGYNSTFGNSVSPAVYDWTSLAPDPVLVPDVWSYIYVPGRQPIIDVILGKYFQQDYLSEDDPVYVGDDSFFGRATTTIQGILTIGVPSTFVQSTFTVSVLSTVVLEASASLVSSFTTTVALDGTLQVAAALFNAATLTTKLDGTLQARSASASESSVTASASLFKVCAAAVSSEFATTVSLDGILQAQAAVSTVSTVAVTGQNIVGSQLIAAATAFTTGITARVTLSGAAAINSAVTVTATALRIQSISAGLSSAFAVAASGNITAGGVVVSAAAFTATAAAVMTLSGAAAPVMAFTVRADGLIQYAGYLVPSINATMTVSGGIIFGTTYCNVQSAFSTSAIANQIFRGSPALTSVFGVTTEGWIFAYERYRKLSLKAESRMLNITPDTRTVYVMGENRIDTISEDDRIVTLTMATRNLMINVPVIDITTNERAL